MIAPPIGRTYRPALWFRGVALLCSLAGLATAGNGLFCVVFNHNSGQVGLIVIGSILTIVGAAIIAYAWTSHISFSDSAIEQSSFLDQKALFFNAIGGRREYTRWVGRCLVRFIRIDSVSGRDRIEIRKSLYDFDDEFWNWFEELPDLNARDYD